VLLAVLLIVAGGYFWYTRNSSPTTQVCTNLRHLSIGLRIAIKLINLHGRMGMN
jgi:hypothetical protein